MSFTLGHWHVLSLLCPLWQDHFCFLQWVDSCNAGWIVLRWPWTSHEQMCPDCCCEWEMSLMQSQADGRGFKLGQLLRAWVFQVCWSQFLWVKSHRKLLHLCVYCASWQDLPPFYITPTLPWLWWKRWGKTESRTHNQPALVLWMMSIAYRVASPVCTCTEYHTGVCMFMDALSSTKQISISSMVKVHLKAPF